MHELEAKFDANKCIVNTQNLEVVTDPKANMPTLLDHTDGVQHGDWNTARLSLPCWFKLLYVILRTEYLVIRPLWMRNGSIKQTIFSVLEASPWWNRRDIKSLNWSYLHWCSLSGVPKSANMVAKFKLSHLSLKDLCLWPVPCHYSNFCVNYWIDTLFLGRC